MPTGGDITEITYTHPTFGSGSFFPKAGEASTYDLGGLRAADESNGVDGAGRSIRQLIRTRWSFEVVCSCDMETRDQERLTALAGSTTEGKWQFAHINGKIYEGVGSPVGDIQADGNAATMTVKVSGGGELKQVP